MPNHPQEGQRAALSHPPVLPQLLAVLTMKNLYCLAAVLLFLAFVGAQTETVVNK